MFKLGLLNEARLDFEMVTNEYPQELQGHFNYALVLM